MIDNDKKAKVEEERERTRKRMRAKVDPENYEFIPAKVQQVDYYDNNTKQRVGIYVRVSTTDVRQTTSFELQKNYYEEFVLKHPQWELVEIYADEGLSGTTRKHRDGFNRMIKDCNEGKLDLIITKSVSRFARDVLITIGIVRELSALRPPVGVFFESECIFSLKEDTKMPLTFIATIAEEESRIRSRSMDASLRMRLDHGIPLTPKLLGYTHDEDGNLIINEEEAPTVKLMFYMYLYGYSTQQIANALIALERKSYLGNIDKWSSSTVTQILRNERHCGEVLTRKTYTPDFHDHKSVKNRGNIPQSHYLKHHAPIVSRDDFLAVQHMLDNAKYGNKSCLPELRVIDSGLLKGFITINPKWAGFKEADYILAARSLYLNDEEIEKPPAQYEVEEGDFDLRGFEITRSEFFDTLNRPTATFAFNKVYLNSECTKKFGADNFVELLINPIERRFAVRPTSKDNRHGLFCSQIRRGKYTPKYMPAAAFMGTIYKLFGWNMSYKYRIVGSYFRQDNEMAYIFDSENSEAYLKNVLVQLNADEPVNNPLTQTGNSIRAIPAAWKDSFGLGFYEHELPLKLLQQQNESDWKLRLEGQLFETGRELQVTPFEILKNYIEQELQGVNFGGVQDE